MNRDTERMVLSDIIYASGSPSGWALIPEPNDKERRFCKKMNIEIIEGDIDDLLTTGSNLTSQGISEETASVQDVGC
jgi:hypothetical protein